MRHLEPSNRMSNVVWINYGRAWRRARRKGLRSQPQMADRTFEMELGRQFADARMLADSDAFAERVCEKLNRGWTVRRLVIGSLGMAGGLIGAAQVLGSGLLGRVGEVTARSDALMRIASVQLPAARGLADLL